MSIVHYALRIQQNNYTYKQMIPFSLFACGIYLPPKKTEPVAYRPTHEHSNCGLGVSKDKHVQVALSTLKGICLVS